MIHFVTPYVQFTIQYVSCQAVFGHGSFDLRQFEMSLDRPIYKWKWVKGNT